MRAYQISEHSEILPQELGVSRAQAARAGAPFPCTT